MSWSVTRAEIESYAEDVLRHKIQCNLPSCQLCHTPSSLFMRHQARPRRFYILSDMLVQVVLCLVIRWRCSGCKKSFTQQPPFAFPRKRYTRESILEFSGCYLEEKASSYRAAVLEESVSFLHAPATKEDPISGKELAHSTLYRWITSLGHMKEVLRCAQDLILQKDPTSSVYRDLASFEVSPRKYIKPAREWISNAAGRSSTWRRNSGPASVLRFSPSMQQGVPGDDLCSPPTLTTKEAYEAKR